MIRKVVFYSAMFSLLMCAFFSFYYEDFWYKQARKLVTWYERN